LWPTGSYALAVHAPVLPPYVNGPWASLSRSRGYVSAIWCAAQLRPLWSGRPRNFHLGGFRWKLGREFSQEQITDAGQPVVMLVRGATILRITLVKHNSQKVVSQNEPRTLWSHQYMFDEEAVCHPLRATLIVIT
jgi:hypothetical protein